MTRGRAAATRWQQRNQLVRVEIVAGNWYVKKRGVELSLGEMYVRGQRIHQRLHTHGQRGACAHVPTARRKTQPSQLFPHLGKDSRTRCNSTFVFLNASPLRSNCVELGDCFVLISNKQ